MGRANRRFPGANPRRSREARAADGFDESPRRWAGLPDEQLERGRALDDAVGRAVGDGDELGGPLVGELPRRAPPRHGLEVDDRGGRVAAVLERADDLAGAAVPDAALD